MVDDLRYAFRQLRLAPGFTAVALVTLALATGANTALFSLFHALVLRPLPLDRPERLVAIATADGHQPTGFPLAVTDGLRRETELFESSAAFLGGGVFTVSAQGLAPVAAAGEFVTGDYFATLRLTPHLGRFLDASDTDAGPAAAQAIVLSHRFWTQRFGSDPNAIGRLIDLNRQPFTIVGVAPPGFSGLWIEISADLIAPMPAFPRVIGILGPFRTAQAAVARLRDDVTLEQAKARMEALWPALIEESIAADLPASLQAALRKHRPTVDVLATGFSFTRDRYTRPLQILLLLTVWMLLVGCLNLAGLILARAASRDREIATRLALGASRARLLRQALVEGVLLSLLGSLCGVPLAWWGSAGLARFIGSDFLIPWSIRVTPDTRVLAVTMLAALVTGVIFALVPALRTVRQQGREALGTSRTIARSTTAWGNGLLVGQFALSLTLLVGATALVQSLAQARYADAGFEADGLYLASLNVPPGTAAAEGATVDYLRSLLAAVGSRAGVTSVALTDTGPASGYLRTMEIARIGDATDVVPVPANLDIISPGFFSTMKIPIEAGRDLTWLDDRTGSRVAVISASLAQRMFPNGDAIGSRIRVGSDPGRQQVEIVGITADASVRDIRQSRPFNVFIAVTQEAVPTGTPELVIRAAGPPPVESDIRTAVESVGHHRLRRFRGLDTQIGRLLCASGCWRASRRSSAGWRRC